MDIKAEIMRRVDSLPVAAQRRVLEHLDSLGRTRPMGKPGSAVLAYPGRLDDTAAAEIIAAVEEECENIDHREW